MGPDPLVDRKAYRSACDRARLIDLPLRIGGGHRQLHDRAGLEVPRGLGCKRGIEYRLGGIGLIDRTLGSILTGPLQVTATPKPR
jgi:hypothetical protein